MLLDETQLFQLGDVRETKFYSSPHVDELKQSPTSWNTYPTKEDPTKKYKFFSLDIQLNRNLKTHSRQTYSVLDWLGDCGGLMDALFFIAKVLANPFSLFALNIKLRRLLVRIQPKDDESRGNLADGSYDRKDFFHKFGNREGDPERNELAKNVRYDMLRTQIIKQ